MAKRSTYGFSVYVARNKTLRRFRKPPLNHRKKLTPSKSRMKKAGSNARH